MGNIYVLLQSICSFFKADVHMVCQIISLLWSISSSTTKTKEIEYAFKSSTSTRISSKSKTFEDVFEVYVVKYIFLGESTHTCMSILVISISLFFIRKYCIGFAYFFELFCTLWVFTYIGVVLHSQFTVGLFYFLFISTFFYPENFVVITLFCHIIFTLTFYSLIVVKLEKILN